MRNLPRHLPRATYRLQFHRGFTLRDALSLLPYLDALGISHVYASPLLMARPGSTHGYDGCDPTRLNPDLGTEEDLEALVSALRARGMGLILDIVPNHLAAAPENPWWWDVLKHGQASRFAGHFDIDWESPDPALRGRVLLPVLGQEYERVLEQGELQVLSENDEVEVRYFEHRFPADPASLDPAGQPLPAWLAEVQADPRRLSAFLERQHYRLCFWGHGDARLNYRRFFTITPLVGVQVERPDVFADSHARILAWHRRGLLDGLRVDHPDGLRDPLGYLQQLREAAPGAWIIVEKILEPGEDLPAAWPVAGTTGYDFLHRVGSLFVDPAGEKPLTDFYAEFTGEPTDFGGYVREGKRFMLRHGLAAEVDRLVRLLAALLAARAPGQTVDLDEWRSALVELIAHFPVYRTYVRSAAEAASTIDLAVISTAVNQALRAQPAPSPAALAFLCELLEGGQPGEVECEFVARFQQLTGPAMAKGVEDTAFYRFNRWVALNEVGGNPACFGLSVEAFHQATEQAGHRWPHAMLATSTHDTKRSEDVRARLVLLSEIPARWIEAVRRWSELNRPHRRQNWPDRNAEYLLYQALVGAWPIPLERAWSYLEKAVREAKQHTDWNHVHAGYEEALKSFVTGALGNARFVEDLEQFVQPLVAAGGLNAAAQTLIKLTAPGVPDLYQGTEMTDLSLVDPDNRRTVGFAQRQHALEESRRRLQAGDREDWLREMLVQAGDGRLKLFVIHQTLQLRRKQEQLFREGGYVPVPVVGQHAAHVCAFARTFEGVSTLTVVPRLMLSLPGAPALPPIGPAVWGNTSLRLPAVLGGPDFQNCLTGRLVRGKPERNHHTLGLAEVLDAFPLALLTHPALPAQPQTSNLDPA